MKGAFRTMQNVSDRTIFLLTHFMPLIFFYTFRKHQKFKGFLIFSRGIERDQRHEMD